MRAQNRWQMNRAGLLNFWYYTEETFDFSDGKLLLRGSNGSGKSVTMQSFLPVLLDGKKSPDRLDPFGSRARKMEDYLLGEKEVVDREERTGYLFIEYKKAETNQYVTTGIGLQAKRGKPLKFWGFVITDKRRINIDIELYKLDRQGTQTSKIPYSRVELERVIGDGGKVVTTQGEYMQLVNKHVFGFESIDAYEELIKLLIQLRSPKLSKDFRPTVIYEILEAALPPLSDDDLRHLSDTIEQMDQTKQQLEQLERELIALQKLSRTYDAYNERHVADLAVEYRMATERETTEAQELEDLRELQASRMREIDTLKRSIQELEQDKATAERQRQRLASHKVWNLAKELENEKEALLRITGNHQRQEERRTKTARRIFVANQEKDKEQLSYRTTLQTIDNLIEDMEYDAEQAAFDRHELNVSDYRRLNHDFDFLTWKQEVVEHTDRLGKVAEGMRALEETKQKLQTESKQLADEQQVRDQRKHEQNDWKKTFEQDLERHLADVYRWTNEHPEFDIEGETVGHIERTLRNDYDPSTYEDVLRLVQPHVVRYQNRLREKVAAKKAAERVIDANIQDVETTLSEWRAKTDPEPTIDPMTKAARDQMRADGVVFAPLYALVEFVDGVDVDIQKRIEAALIDNGMLDALITETDVTYDRVLLPAPQMMAHTLADYLKPSPGDTGIASDRIDDVLRSVLIGDSETSIREDGTYRLGQLKGHAVPVEHVRFLGRVARKRYRDEKIEQLTYEIEQLQLERVTLRGEQAELRQQIELADAAWNVFPSDRDLRMSHQEIQKVRFEIESLERRCRQIEELLKQTSERFNVLKREVYTLAEPFELEKTQAAFEQAKRAMVNYKDLLLETHREHDNAVASNKRLVTIETSIEEAEEDILELMGALNELEDGMERVRKNIAKIEEQLKQEDADDIHQQSQAVQAELARIESELSRSWKLVTTRETQLEADATKLDAKSHSHTLSKQMRQAWEMALKAEWKRGVVSLDVDGDDPEVLSQTIEAVYGKRLTSSASKADELLSKAFIDQQNDLMEYRMRNFTDELPLEAWMQSIDDRFRREVEMWQQKTTRRIISLDLRGQQASPQAVKRTVEEEFARQESILNESDKELYEEILFKSVGTKLRSRIRRAEQWTEKMNALMESRNTSSGLTFSIKWRPRTAESEEELDTKDLVHILKQDAKLLKDEDFERITTHFRSKLSKAKQMIKEDGDGQTLLQVLREVLDYRKWFSFVLYFERTNEPKRELTNNNFFKFSGGEKAMAMYIPLFTACYSRYQEAADTAPYIISLDEAFAGVDENNIREMFEIVEQLGFDYIMNSQILWGDYDTISSLSICELLRPKNADYVTVLHYVWDGEKRHAREETLL
ncbi:TIGR02680 family protein [Exiguobacterium alkaliphilum]|uniref:TIGR02680 family protein n=1 Tax=Exiguobacterium alkaliphilum TaxID=1428684 RepID=UPI001BABA496|nr:TIGR02680 family protein [Exiguobacterium alkaliphilum]QUE86344.1 TIGR02680 family protein [Exiguobacterium alkaliphilum]